MEQPTFGELEYENKKRKTRREKFLERMEGLIPWEGLEGGYGPTIRRLGEAGGPTNCQRCCGSTVCSCSTT